MSAPRTTALPVSALMVLITLAVAACGSTSATPVRASAPSSAPVSVAPSRAPAPGAPVAPAAGKAPCTGWPSAPSGRLPRAFQPASVLRCVTETVSVPGKGQWATAILEKADQNLIPLTGALSAASGHMEPGHMCPEYVIVPPRIVLVGKDGTMIRPAFPVTGCGQIQQKVLAALDGLHWRTVSRRLLTKIPA